MTNVNPAPAPNQRLQNRLDAERAGKGFRIVVEGKCKVCKRRSPDVPATRRQVMGWFASGTTHAKRSPEGLGFTQYQERMLREGLHRDCQKVADAKARDKAEAKNKAAANRVARGARRPVVLEEGKVERAIQRRRQNGRKAAKQEVSA